MVKLWLQDKVNRLRHRLDHNKMPEEPTPLPNTLNVKTDSDKPTGFRMTREKVRRLQKWLETKSVQFRNDYADENDKIEEICKKCSRRKGKFIGDCLYKCKLCRHCCHLMILESVFQFNEETLILDVKCTCCYSSVSTLTRRKPISECENFHDENVPNTGYIEHSISISEFTHAICDGRINRGFESSSSM